MSDTRNGSLLRWIGYVPGHGHRWLTRADDGALFLVRNPERPAEGFNYELFESFPALFRNFAALYPNGGRWGPDQLDSIRRFANQYGSLMLEMEQAKGEAGTSDWGTPVESWRREISDLSFAVRIWDLWDARNEEGLSRYFFFDDEGKALGTLNGPDNYGRTYSLRVLRDTHEAHPFVKGDVLAPAALVLKHVIDEHLRPRRPEEPGGTNKALEWTDSTQQKFAVVDRPVWLHDALWRQFASAVTGGKSYGLCDCGQWFEKKTQRPQLYCSNRCKTKAFRDKRVAESKGETK